jgi:hypothetical protein
MIENAEILPLDSALNAEKTQVIHYEREDYILPMLNLPQPCYILLTVEDDTVSLTIGDRWIQWDRKTGRFQGAGTWETDEDGELI